MKIALRRRLAPVGSAEFAWRNSHVASEHASEMTVVGESAFQRHPSDRDISRDESSARVLNPEATHIFAERQAGRSPEAARQMNRMNARRLRSLLQRYGLSIARMQECQNLFHPWEVLRIFAGLLWK